MGKCVQPCSRILYKQLASTRMMSSKMQPKSVKDVGQIEMQQAKTWFTKVSYCLSTVLEGLYNEVLWNAVLSWECWVHLIRMILKEVNYLTMMSDIMIAISIGHNITWWLFQLYSIKFSICNIWVTLQSHPHQLLYIFPGDQTSPA